MVYITGKDIVKEYKMGDVIVKANDGINFEIAKGEFVTITGASGSGKSTLLNIIGGMERPTSGKLTVDNLVIDENIKDIDLTRYRREKIGFVFQFYNLIPTLTSVENIRLASNISSNPIDALEVLKIVGLYEKQNSFPSQMSGGEQQRVAIARAISKNPDLILCDEPTGALDYQNSKLVLKILFDLGRKYKKTIIVVTHNVFISPMADRVINIKNGKVNEISVNKDPTPIDIIEW